MQLSKCYTSMSSCKNKERGKYFEHVKQEGKSTDFSVKTETCRREMTSLRSNKMAETSRVASIPACSGLSLMLTIDARPPRCYQSRGRGWKIRLLKQRKLNPRTFGSLVSNH